MTDHDIREARENQLARIENDLLLLKWMLCGVVWGVLALLIKAFIDGI